MFEIVLFQPEIPPNAGNVIRLAANTGSRLHFVAPLGFSLEDRYLARAGLDYGDVRDITMHADWAACRQYFEGRRLFAFSTRGRRHFAHVDYRRGDVFVFGPETRGLPDAVLAERTPAERLYLPMRPANRSVNLSNAVAVVVFEAWRQLGYAGASTPGG